MEESCLWFFFFVNFFSDYFLSMSGDYLLASVLFKCNTAFGICQILNHSIQPHSNTVNKKMEFVGIIVPFLLLILFLDRHVVVPEIKFWTLQYIQETRKRKKKNNLCRYVDHVCKCFLCFSGTRISIFRRNKNFCAQDWI